MANSTTPLTDTQIRRKAPQPKEYNLSDGGGLQLRIKPSGSKAWLFNYSRPETRKRTNMKLGSYPNLTLADARKRREECKSLLEHGIDPQEYRSEQARELTEAGENTLKHVTDQWFAIKVKKDKLTEDYAEDLYNSLANHVFPKLGSRPIHKITALEVTDVLEPLQDAGKLETLRRICQRLNMIMNFAVRKELTSVNKLHSIGEDFQTPPPKQHLPTIKPEKLPKLMEDIGGASIRPITGKLIVWQLHTMVRPSEAAGARWEEIDFKNRVWSIPASRMKKKREHVVPLSNQVLQILEDLKPLNAHRDYIFSSDISSRKPANSSTANMALRRMGYKGKLVAHGLRSIASTVLHEQQFSSDLIETALAHVDKNATRAAYNRAEYLEQRKVMMQWWSDHIEEATTGTVPNKGKKHLKVVNG
jgi:integrase